MSWGIALAAVAVVAFFVGWSVVGAWWFEHTADRRLHAGWVAVGVVVWMAWLAVPVALLVGVLE